MTSIGRGRGWARPTERESVLRRPGQSSSPKSPELDELVDMIYDLHIDDSSPASKIRDVYTSIINLAEIKFPENIPMGKPSSELVTKLFKLALEDRCFAIKFMNLYTKKNPPSKITLIRNILLINMQENYDKREELHRENPSYLSNLVWIMGVALETFAIGSQLRVHVSSALITCCSMLLDSATEEDTETVAIQIYLNGKAIDAALAPASKSATPPVPSENVGLSEIVNKARTNLVNRNVSTRTRALLLLIIDFANQRYEPLTGDLQAFYASVLGSSRALENDSQFRTGREFNSEAYLYEILTKGMRLPKNENNPVTAIAHETTRNELPPPQVQKKNRGPNGGVSGPTPRAIRGSGASESSKEHKNDKRSPRGHKEKLTDEQVWSAKQNTGSKVWGHDDRFDNDYESK